jgi:hypothetical protein
MTSADNTHTADPATDPMADPAAATLAYVRSAAVFLDLPLDEGRARRVAQHLMRTQAIAALLHEVPLGAHDEPAEIYRPAPFPDADAVAHGGSGGTGA